MVKVVICVKGIECEADFDAFVNLMDDDLREQVHAAFAPCTEQEFIDHYCQFHAERFGEDFQV